MSSAVEFGLMTDGADVERLVTGEHHDPHHVLGAHPGRDSEGRDCVVIRGWRPDAAGLVIVAGEQRIQMHRVHPAGVFAGMLEGPGIPDYRLETAYPDGTVVTADDPYRYLPTLGPLDLHLLAEGRTRGCGVISGRSRECTRGRLAPRSRSGRPAPGRSGSLVTSTAGTAACTR